MAVLTPPKKAKSIERRPRRETPLAVRKPKPLQDNSIQEEPHWVPFQAGMGNGAFTQALDHRDNLDQFTGSPAPKSPGSPPKKATEPRKEPGQQSTGVKKPARTGKPTAAPSQPAAKSEKAKTAGSKEAAHRNLAGQSAGRTGGNPGDVLARLGNTPPSATASGMHRAWENSSAAFDEMHDALAANPPSVERPSGLPRKGTPNPLPKAVGKPVPNPEKTVPGPGEQPEMAIHHEVTTQPLPVSGHATSVVHRAPEKGEALERAAAEALAALPTRDDSVNTTAGDHPTVALSGAADPSRLDEDLAKKQEASETAWTESLAEMRVDEGENDIFPSVPEETLSASLNVTKTPGKGSFVRQPVSPHYVQAEFDRTASQHWSEEMAKATAEYEKADQKAKADELRERESTREAMAQLEQETAATQTAAQIAAKKTVQTAREDWRSELEDAETVYTGKTTKLRSETMGQIEATKREADGEAAAEMAAGEARAEKRRQQAYEEAEAEKQAAEQESGGFLDWLKSSAEAFIQHMGEVIDTIFDVMRAAVQQIIEFAKKAAAWVIEQARKAIVGLIETFGKRLELAADIFLAAFPEARDRAKASIRAGVQDATKTVNEAAEALKQGINKLLDALAAVLDFILVVFQKSYKLILDGLEWVVNAMLDALERIGYLVNAAEAMPDHFEDQMISELTGMDLTEPLPFERTKPLDAQTAAMAAVEGGAATSADAAVLTKANLTAKDMAVDPIGSFVPDAELLRLLAMPDGGEIEFGENPNAATVAELQAEAASGLAGTTPAATDQTQAMPAAAPVDDTEARLQQLIDQEPEGTCTKEKKGEPAKGDSGFPEHMKFGPLSKEQRGRYLWSQMKKGIAHWFSCNWPWLLAAVVAALLGLIAANILTGGAIMAALPLVMQILGAVMTGIALGKVTIYVGKYLGQGWAGQIVDAAKSLARGLAIGAIELVFALLFNIGAIIKAAKSVLKHGIKASAKTATKLAARSVTTTGKNLGKVAIITKTGAVTAYKNGKLILKGATGNIVKGAKSLDDLARRLARKFRFKKFKIKRRGKRIQLWGYLNPWIMFSDGTVEEISFAGKGGDDFSVGMTKTVKPGDVKHKISGPTDVIVVGWKSKPSQTVQKLKQNMLTKAGKKENQEFFNTIKGLEPDRIKALLYNQESTYQLRKGIKGPKPKFFQAHHLIPRELRGNKKIKKFLDKIGFEFEGGAINGIILPHKKNHKVPGFSKATVHNGSHPNYTIRIRKNLTKMAEDYTKRLSKINQQGSKSKNKLIKELNADMEKRLKRYLRDIKRGLRKGEIDLD